MLKTSSLIDISTSSTLIVVEYNGVDNVGDSNSNSNKNCSFNASKSICSSAPCTLMFKISLSIDLLTKVTKIVVEFDEVDDGGSSSDSFDRKFTF